MRKCRSVLALCFTLLASCRGGTAGETLDIVTDLNQANKTYQYYLVKDDRGERLVRGECIGGVTESFCNNALQARDYVELKKRLTDLIKLPPLAQIDASLNATQVLVEANAKDLDAMTRKLADTERLLAMKNAELSAMSGFDVTREKARYVDLSKQEDIFKQKVRNSPDDADVKQLLGNIQTEMAVLGPRIFAYDRLFESARAFGNTKTAETKARDDLQAKRDELAARKTLFAAERRSADAYLSARLGAVFNIIEERGAGYRILTADTLFPNYRGDVAHLDNVFEQSTRVPVSVKRFFPVSPRGKAAIMGDGTVVQGAENGFVYWYKDGKEVFKFKTEGSVRSSAAVMSDGTVVVGSYDAFVYWLKDGKEVFKFQTKDYVHSSPAIMSDGTVVVGSYDDFVYWLKDGKEVFKFKTQAGVASSPAIMSDGTVVIGSQDGFVYWLKDGKEIFKFRTENYVHSSPADLSRRKRTVGYALIAIDARSTPVKHSQALNACAVDYRRLRSTQTCLPSSPLSLQSARDRSARFSAYERSSQRRRYRGSCLCGSC